MINFPCPNLKETRLVKKAPSSAICAWNIIKFDGSSIMRAAYGRDLYLLEPTLGPPKKFQHFTRAEEVIITRLRICHTKATNTHVLSRGPPTTCRQYGQTLTIDRMLLKCAVLQESRAENYTVDSLNTVFKTVPETWIIEFL